MRKAVQVVELDVSDIVMQVEWEKLRDESSARIDEILCADGVCDLIVKGIEISDCSRSYPWFSRELSFTPTPSKDTWRNRGYTVQYFSPSLPKSVTYGINTSSWSRTSETSARVKLVAVNRTETMAEYELSARFISNAQMLARAKGDIADPNVKGMKVFIKGTIWEFMDGCQQPRRNIKMEVVDGKLVDSKGKLVDALNEQEILEAFGLA
jgi:hypothetical protein